jgi:hypothetical protein
VVKKIYFFKFLIPRLREKKEISSNYSGKEKKILYSVATTLEWW